MDIDPLLDLCDRSKTVTCSIVHITASSPPGSERGHLQIVAEVMRRGVGGGAVVIMNLMDFIVTYSVDFVDL